MSLLINDDLSRRVIVTPREHRWVASPQPGVDRMMLDRKGGEIARATSLVRYAPGSAFARHAHPGGEEILVLSGTFSEDGRHYPAGWYLRSPPGSSHTPSSREGTTLFVKLCQMTAEESYLVRIDTGDASNWRIIDGLHACPLFDNDHEQVMLIRLAPAEMLPLRDACRTELLLLEGHLIRDETTCEAGTWMRLPDGDMPGIRGGSAGARLYVKFIRMASSAPGERA